MIKGENNSVLQQQCIQTKNRLARPLSLVVMMAVLLCALFTVAALPVEPREVLLKKTTGASFAGVKNASELDMGVVAPLNDIVSIRSITPPSAKMKKTIFGYTIAASRKKPPKSGPS